MTSTPSFFFTEALNLNGHTCVETLPLSCFSRGKQRRVWVLRWICIDTKSDGAHQYWCPISELCIAFENAEWSNCYAALERQMRKWGGNKQRDTYGDMKVVPSPLIYTNMWHIEHELFELKRGSEDISGMKWMSRYERWLVMYHHLMHGWRCEMNPTCFG